MQDFNSGTDRASRPVESNRASVQSLADRLSRPSAEYSEAPSEAESVDPSHEPNDNGTSDGDASADLLREPACVLVLTGSSIGRLYRFMRNQCRIGRAPQSDITLTEESVSWDHAEVRVTDGSYILRVTDPSNVTYVNGVRITEHCLAIGDRIQLGDGPILKFSAFTSQSAGKPEQAGKARASGSPLVGVKPSKRPV